MNKEVYDRKDLAEIFNCSPKTIQRRLDELYVKFPNKTCLSRFFGKKQFFTRTDIEEIKKLCLQHSSEKKVRTTTSISARAARFFCIVDYRGQLQIKDKKKMKELCLTDTFDKLSPLYDYPHTIKQVNKRFENKTHTNLEINTGYNGIEIHLDL